jgi:hypothetical protein
MDFIDFYLECLAYMFTDFPFAFDLPGIVEYAWRSVIAVGIPAVLFAGGAWVAERVRG